MRRAHGPGAEAVLVEEGPHPVEHEERRLRRPLRVGRGLDDVGGRPGRRRHRAILCADAPPPVPDAPRGGVVLRRRRPPGRPGRGLPERRGPGAGRGRTCAARGRHLRPRPRERPGPHRRDGSHRRTRRDARGVGGAAGAARRPAVRYPGRGARVRVRARVPRRRPERQALPRRRDGRRALRSPPPRARAAARGRELGHDARRAPRSSEPRGPRTRSPASGCSSGTSSRRPDA